MIRPAGSALLPAFLFWSRNAEATLRGRVQQEALRHRESGEKGNRHAPGEENGMKDRTGALPTACELATKRCFGLSQRRESKISWPSAAVPRGVLPMNWPSA